MEYSNFPPYMNIDLDSVSNDAFNNPIFNPISQYEQGYLYYKYLCMQLEYKIKCKEYEKICLKEKSKE